jgi:predicted nucleic acid-binding protein
MRALVLDASAALSWMLPAQATAAGVALLTERDSWVFQAPAIFEWEVHNVLLTMDRRGAFPAGDYDEALAIYESLDVQLNTLPVDIHALAGLARKARVSLFDASYLTLALDHDCPLASRDKALLEVAVASGVACFDLRATSA